MNRISLAVLLSTMLILVGCGRDDDRPDVDVPQVDETARSELFDRIDADSIYLMANLEPLPEKLSNLMWASLEAMSEINQDAYDDAMDELDHPVMQALIRELRAIDSREALEARGLHSNGLWAIHGISLYPVVHWQLVDSSAFIATLDRIATESGMELTWRGVGEEEVLWIEMGDFGIAMHHDEQFVTAAIVPDDMPMLRRIANLDQPARPYSSSQLKTFNQERGFTPQGSGYFDFRLLIDRLLDEDDELIQAARQQAEMPSLAEDPACSEELRRLTEIFPRMSMGATHMSDNEIAASWIIETERSVGEKLAAIADSPVRIDGNHGEMFSAGLAFNLVAARDFARETVSGWVDNPPECALFSGIRESAADWQLAVNRPIPPMVTNLQGLRVSVDEFQFDEMMNVTDVSASLAVFMRNPQMIIGMAQMFSPELAELQLRPGGDPQPVPPGMIPNMPGVDAWIAMGENAIGLALGEDQKDKLAPSLEPGKADSAILRYGIDFGTYAKMLEAMMDRTRTRIAESAAEFDMAEDNEEILAAIGEIYDYSELSIHLKPHGIEINSLMRLHD